MARTTRKRSDMSGNITAHRAGLPHATVDRENFPANLGSPGMCARYEPE
jgi:hypothetical protein